MRNAYAMGMHTDKMMMIPITSSMMEANLHLLVPNFETIEAAIKITVESGPNIMNSSTLINP